jgi:FKBP-type peptidyl-prolyl cis-trans isomerase
MEGMRQSEVDHKKRNMTAIQCAALVVAISVLLGAPAAAAHRTVCPGPAAAPAALRETCAAAAYAASLPRLALRGGASAEDPPGGTADADDDEPLIVDLTGDRGVLKITTRPGAAGPGPVDRDEVYVLFNGTIESLDNRSTAYNGKSIAGVRFDSTSEGVGANLPRSFQVGGGNTLAGWDLAVRNMTRGERATVYVHSDFAYGPHGHTMRSGVFIPPNATLKFELELLRWNEKDLYNNGSVVVSYTKTPDAERPENDNHPEDADEVLVRYTGRVNDQVFTSSGASPVWVALSDTAVRLCSSLPYGPDAAAFGPSTLPRGLLRALTAEAVKGGRYTVTLSSDFAYGVEGRAAEARGVEHAVPVSRNLRMLRACLRAYMQS